MKVGIYGGTFDPVHNEHVNIAKNAIKELSLDKLIILPSGEPPHKLNQVITDKKKRLKMCELAFTDEKMEISTYEIEKKTKSYTYETLEYFHSDEDEIFFIMGGDSLGDIYKWKNPARIFELATIVVVGRFDYADSDFTKAYEEKILRLAYDPEEISATEIRCKREFGFDVVDMVPLAINDYIEEHELYTRYRKMTKKVQKMLTESRYMHTMNTTICGVSLAPRANVDVENAFVACALHDVAKCMTDYSDFKKKLKKENMFMPLPVMHAFVGSYVVKKDFGIVDKDIRNAIKYHTTGRPNMSQLEKLVYVADCIEKSRDYEGVDDLRTASKKDFEKTFVLCLNSLFSVLDDKTMCPLTLDAIDYYGK